jgi:hypothetical protein
MIIESKKEERKREEKKEQGENYREKSSVRKMQ